MQGLSLLISVLERLLDCTNSLPRFNSRRDWKLALSSATTAAPLYSTPYPYGTPQTRFSSRLVPSAIYRVPENSGSSREAGKLRCPRIRSVRTGANIRHLANGRLAHCQLYSGDLGDNASRRYRGFSKGARSSEGPQGVSRLRRRYLQECCLPLAFNRGVHRQPSINRASAAWRLGP